MNTPLYLYALIKSLYDKGEDYLDSFWPFVIQVATINKPKDIIELQKDVKNKFSLDIPLHVLKTIISRAKHKDLLKQSENKFVLTRQGEESQGQLEDEESVQRRIESLMNDIVLFFKDNQVNISSTVAYDLVNTFIQSNLTGLIEYLNPKEKVENNLNNEKNKQNENLLVAYLIKAQNSKPAEYAVLKEMVYGSIISTVLNVSESTNLNEIKNSFNNCTIYLDSNIALSVLGLTSVERNEPARELIELMRDLGIKLKIFDFTVFQIRKVIGAYAREYDLYDPSIRVDSIYSDMQLAGWVPSDIQEYLFNLENKFTELGISVEYTEIAVDSDKPFNGKFETLKQYKTTHGDVNGPSTAGLNHDLIAIEKIRQIRKKPVTSLETSKALFLSSDAKLHWFDYKEMGHRDAHTVAEVILDRIFANILWLKNPNVELPLKSIIASHSRNLFIKKSIWNRFYEVLKKLEQDKKITDEQISVLFYNNDMEVSLKQFEDQEVGKVTETFVLKGIEDAQKTVNEKIKIENEKLRNEFLKKLKETEEEIRKGAEKDSLKFEEKMERVRINLHGSSVFISKVIIWPILIIMYLCMAYVVYYSVFVKHLIKEDTLVIISTISGLTGIGLLIFMYKLGKRLINWLSKKIYARRIAKFDIEN